MEGRGRRIDGMYSEAPTLTVTLQILPANDTSQLFNSFKPNEAMPLMQLWVLLSVIIRSTQLKRNAI